MPQQVRVGSVSEVPPGSAKEFVVGDQVLAVFNVDGQLYALDGVCPHAGGPLAEGEMQGSTVTCPWHGWQFDVCTGQNKLNARITHKRFAVQAVGDDLLVEIP